MVPVIGSIADGVRAGRVARAASVPQYFPAGTPILTQDGQKPIEEIRVGDRVVSADPDTGERSIQRVVRTFRRPADELFTLTLADGSSTEATGEPLFWVEGKGFIVARKLARSDLLRNASGSRVALREITSRRGEFTVYNFEVEVDHTYFVGTAN